jgi:hypothetical protein
MSIIQNLGRFYGCDLNIKVIENIWGRLSVNAPNHISDPFLWWLAAQSRHAASRANSLRLPDDSPSLRLKSPEVIQVTMCRIGFDLSKGLCTFITI